jgi:hypothetical protein
MIAVLPPTAMDEKLADYLRRTRAAELAAAATSAPGWRSEEVAELRWRADRLLQVAELVAGHGLAIEVAWAHVRGFEEDIVRAFLREVNLGEASCDAQ